MKYSKLNKQKRKKNIKINTSKLKFSARRRETAKITKGLPVRHWHPWDTVNSVIQMQISAQIKPKDYL